MLSPPVCLVSGKNTNSGYLRSVLLGAEKMERVLKKPFFSSLSSFKYMNEYIHSYLHSNI